MDGLRIVLMHKYGVFNFLSHSRLVELSEDLKTPHKEDLLLTEELPHVIATELYNHR